MPHLRIGPYKEGVTIDQIQMPFHAVGRSFSYELLHVYTCTYTSIYCLLHSLLYTPNMYLHHLLLHQRSSNVYVLNNAHIIWLYSTCIPAVVHTIAIANFYILHKNDYINYKKVPEQERKKNMFFNKQQKVGMLLTKRADTRLVGISNMRKSIYLLTTTPKDSTHTHLLLTTPIDSTHSH